MQSLVAREDLSGLSSQFLGRMATSEKLGPAMCPGYSNAMRMSLNPKWLRQRRMSSRSIQYEYDSGPPKNRLSFRNSPYSCLCAVYSKPAYSTCSPGETRCGTCEVGVITVSS